MNAKVNFSNITPIYDLLGTLAFAGRLHKSQQYMLELYPKSVENILIIGGGTGKFLTEIVSSIKFNELIYIDISPGMIKSARKKIVKNSPDQLSNIEFICGGINNLPKKDYDLVITHYFLDCLTPESYLKIVEELKNSLKPTGLWSMVDFYNTNQDPLKKRFISLLYRFFHITCNLPSIQLTDFDSWFNKNMNRLNRKEFIGGLLKSTLYKKEN